MELELAWVCDESARKFAPVPKHLVAEADAAAKQALADSDMWAPRSLPGLGPSQSCPCRLLQAAHPGSSAVLARPVRLVCLRLA